MKGKSKDELVDATKKVQYDCVNCVFDSVLFYLAPPGSFCLYSVVQIKLENNSKVVQPNYVKTPALNIQHTSSILLYYQGPILRYKFQVSCLTLATRWQPVNTPGW